MIKSKPEPKPKFIFLQPTVGKYRYGFYRSLLELSRDSHDIYVFCSRCDSNKVNSIPSLGNHINYNNDLSCLSAFNGRIFWQSIIKIVKTLRNNDTLIVNGNPRYLSNLFVSLYAKIVGVKIVWWGHGWTAGGSEKNAKIRFTLMRLYDHVFLYTDSEVALYRNAIGHDVSLSALNNGVDVSDIRSKACVFKRHTDSYRMSFIGRLEDKCNFDVLVDALKIIKENDSLGENIVVDVIGDGSNINYYKKIADVAGVNDMIIWRGGIWDPLISNDIMSSSAFFIYPGQVGLSVIHAFALGLPAIIHDNYDLQMPEASAVKDGVNGSLFSHGNAHSLADKIIEMMSDRKKLAKMRDAAFNTVTNSYNTEDMAKRFYFNM